MTYFLASSILHGLAAAVFAALTVYVGIRGRMSRTGRFLFAACLATTLWAASVAIEGGFGRVSSVLETARIAAWALFTAHLLRGVMKDRRNLPRWILAGPIVALLLTTIALDLPENFPVGEQWLSQISWLSQTDRIVRILLAVSGFLLLENLYRNALPESRWHINLLTIGIGLIFIYDILLYADAALFHSVSPALFVARPLIDSLASPLLALSIAHNQRWLVDIRMSRNVIFHSSTLLISGIFLLAIGVAGEVLRDIGVTWGPVLEIALVFGALVFVAVAFTSGRARSELRVFLVQNFFRSQYDYRKVWLAFISTLSNPSFSGEQLQVRVIRAVADTVDSPAGSLWLSDSETTSFSPVASWNLPRGGEPVDPDFAKAFREGQWIVEFAKPLDAVIPDGLARTRSRVLGQVFAELAEKFQPMVDALNDISETSYQHSDKDILRLYEPARRGGLRERRRHPRLRGKHRDHDGSAPGLRRESDEHTGENESARAIHDSSEKASISGHCEHWIGSGLRHCC